MESDTMRWRLTGGGFVVVGVVIAIVAYLQLDAPLASGLFGLVALAGVLLLLQRERAYALTLVVVGILAVLSGVLGYLAEGLVTLTLLYFLLGIAGTVQGVQTYQAID